MCVQMTFMLVESANESGINANATSTRLQISTENQTGSKCLQCSDAQAVKMF